MTDFDDDLLSDTAMESDNPVKLLQDIASSAYREDLVRTLVAFREKLEGQQLTQQQLRIKYKVLQALDMAHKNENLPKVEKLIRSTTSFFAEPTQLVQLRISITIIVYTVLTAIGFVMLTMSESIMLPSFNIPYSVLLMGMIGCLVSMYVKLPRIKNETQLLPDATVWFIISPPISIIMAGLFFGLCQILLNLTTADITNEYWYYWILAWIVGFVNWVAVYEKTSWGVAAVKPSIARVKKPEDEIDIVPKSEVSEPEIEEDFGLGFELDTEEGTKDDTIQSASVDTDTGEGPKPETDDTEQSGK